MLKQSKLYWVTLYNLKILRGCHFYRKVTSKRFFLYENLLKDGISLPDGCSFSVRPIV